jgi:hypothetical protein
MCKKNYLITATLLTATFLLMCTNAIAGIQLFEGKLDVSGFVKNDSAVRLSDGQKDLHGIDTYGLSGTAQGLDSGDYYLCRNTLQLELTYNLTDLVTLFGTYRGFYDASLDLDKDLEENFINADAESQMDDFESFQEIRELYVDLVQPNWKIRVGKQQIVWGESDGFRMADIINPLDFSWQYFFPSWEDIRIPLVGLDFMYTIPSKNEITFEFVWLPGTFDRGFESNKLAPSGANWSSGFFQQYFHSALDAGTLSWQSAGLLGPNGHLKNIFPPALSFLHNRTGVVQYFLDSLQESENEKSIRNSALGLRINGRFGNWDVSVFDFYSRSFNPSFKKDWVARALTPGADRDSLFDYLFVNKIGGTFNVNNKALKTVFRGECVFTNDEPFLPKDPFTLAPSGLEAVTYEKDTFAYMIGFDRPTFIKLLNPTKTFFISGQVFQKYIVNYDNRMTTFDMSNDHSQTLFTLVVNTGYNYDTILPQIFMMYNPSGEGWVQPQVEIVYRNYWRFGIGANILMSNDKKQAYFGGMRDNDNLFAWAKFAW